MREGNFWGLEIKRIRREQGISQRALASGAKVNRSTLRRIEQGIARGDIDIVERLFDYLGYELEAMSRESIANRLNQLAAQENNPDRKSRLIADSIFNMMLV